MFGVDVRRQRTAVVRAVALFDGREREGFPDAVTRAQADQRGDRSKIRQGIREQLQVFEHRALRGDGRRGRCPPL